MFQAPAAGRTTLIHMALDANIPVIVIAGYGLARHGDPIAVLLAAPWLLLTALAFPVTLAVAELYDPRCSWWSPLVSLRIVAATLAVVALFGVAYYFAVDRSNAWELFTVLAVAMAAEVFVVRSVTALQDAPRARRALRPGDRRGLGGPHGDRLHAARAAAADQGRRRHRRRSRRKGTSSTRASASSAPGRSCRRPWRSTASTW